MSRYTTELRSIVNNNFDIFDFEYKRKAESQAIVSDEDLQNGFINHFYFREVGFETLERFKHKLKTQWIESLGEFDSLLIAYNDKIDIKSNRGSSRNSTINFTGSSSKNIESNSSENNSSETSSNSTLSSNKQNLVVENDTPKSAIDIDDQLTHASKLIKTEDNQNDTGTNTGTATESNTQENNSVETGSQNDTTTNQEQNKGYEGITEIELLEIYHNKIKDIQTEFYNSFDNLFMQIF